MKGRSTLGLARGLLGELWRREPERNQFVSPASVLVVLLLLWRGARAETRDAIAAAVGMQDCTVGDIEQAIDALARVLRTAPAGVELSVASSLWLREGLAFSDEYVQEALKRFDAALFLIPESTDPVNAWVAERTGGRISRILDSIDPLSVLLVVNAVCFKGRWTSPFDPLDTHPDVFHLSADSCIEHPLMRQEGEFEVWTDRLVDGIRLPYGSGNVVMEVVIPKRVGDFAAVWDSLGEGLAAATAEEIRLAFPSFRGGCQVDLEAPLSQLGMGLVFDAVRADFGDMFSQPPAENVYLTRVLHEVVIDVDEAGTTAAAATVAGVVLMDGSSGPREIRVDRPFAFLIRDRETGVVWFAGTVVDPSAGAVAPIDRARSQSCALFDLPSASARSLDDVARSLAQLPEQELRDEALAVIGRIGDAIARAHASERILQREGAFGLRLHPTGIWLEESGEVRIDRPADGNLSKAYASLDEWDGVGSDPRGYDVYALGCIAYELLSGRHPFYGLPAPHARDVNAKPKPIRGLNRVQNRALARALRFGGEAALFPVEQLLDGLGIGRSSGAIGAEPEERRTALSAEGVAWSVMALALGAGAAAVIAPVLLGQVDPESVLIFVYLLMFVAIAVGLGAGFLMRFV